MEIIIENLKLHTIIGILEEERKNAQNIIIDSKINYIYVNEYINYAEIVDLISKKCDEKKYMLLEDALIDISNEVLSRYKNIISIFLCIKKPDILSNCTIGISDTFYAK